MLVKKMPILQWFPDFETVKSLSFPEGFKGDFHPVFYDIETTGLSRNSTFCYLIGAAAFEDGKWQIYQWLAQREQDEPLLLREFSRFLSRASLTIQYNGSQFDQPYLEERCRIHKMQSPFQDKPALDLYRILKPLKNLLKLPKMKQPHLEEFLRLPKRSYLNGQECIRLFRNYIKNQKPETAEALLGHNQEDLQGLGRILSMIRYLDITEGKYQAEEACFDSEYLLMTAKLSQKLPVPFSNGTTDFYIKGEEELIRVAVKAANGRVRQYYPNYKDYHYIPSEDTAMPKTLSSCLDKSLRRPATPQTCYTWFDCSGSFLTNKKQQLSYLQNTLPFLLSTLKQGSVPTPAQ